MVASPGGVRIPHLDLIKELGIVLWRLVCELNLATILRHILLLKLYLRKILLLLIAALGLLIAEGEWVYVAVTEGLLAVVLGHLCVLG